MKVKPRNAPQLLLLALAIGGCEYIGPQLHKKLPLPQQTPISDAQFAVPDTNAVEAKSAKTELFPDDDSSIATTAAKAKKTKSGGKGEYSLNFDDADLAEVAKVILGDILATNYTISPQVSGKVTLQTTDPLSRDELIPTLEMLLSINNAALVNQGDMYLIKPSNEAVYNTSIRTLGSGRLPTGYQTAVIPVRNVSAGELAEILKPLLPEKAQVSVDNRRNILLASGSASELNRIIDVVGTFDIDVLKGRSFGLFTPAHVDAGKLIDELDQIFNAKTTSDKDAGQSFFRFIEIERMNAILAITHNAKYLHDIENWVLRLDRINSEAGGGVNVYRAQHVSAVDLADTLNNIFGMGGSSRGSRSASIAAGRRSASASNRGSSSSTGGSSSMSTSGGSGTGGSRDSGQDRTLADRQSQTARSSGFSGTSASAALGGSLGAAGFGGTGEMANVRIIPDESNNALVIVSSNEEYEKIIKVIKQLDVLPLQVIIDATIVEVNLVDGLEYGIQWYLTHNNGGTNIVTGGANNGIDIADIGKGIASGGFSYAFSSNSRDINAVLKAGATNNNINVISSPSLMVLNNQEATIKVGDSVPIRSSVSSNLSGNANNGIVQTSSIQMVDTGVILSVRPRVNAGGLVLMEVLQSVNQATKTDTSVEIDSPTIQKREIETSVAIQSGETIVLGGLIKENNRYNRFGVPLLHEIPLLGPLFGSTDRNKDKSELVVLLTPRVVNSRQDARSITDEFRRKLSSIYVIPENVEPETEVR